MTWNPWSYMGQSSSRVEEAWVDDPRECVIGGRWCGGKKALRIQNWYFAALMGV